MGGRLQDLSVVILSHNRLDELKITFHALCSLTLSEDLELIIVDNASQDGSREAIQRVQQQYPQVEVVLNDANLGVGPGRNSGWRMATRPYLLNLDDDTRVDTELLVRLLDAARSHDRAGVIFPQVLDFTTRAPLAQHSVRGLDTANFLGACHVVRTCAIADVGLLDPDCSFGGEELDYSIRMRAHGWDVVLMPDIEVAHNGMKRDAAHDKWRRIEWTRNAVRVCFKHFPPSTAAKFALRMSLSQLKSGARAHGLPFVAPLLRSVGRGARQGRAAYTAIPSSVVAFYSDPDLRPDLGNVPFIVKLGSRARRKQARAT